MNARIGASPATVSWRVIPPAASIGAAVAIIGIIALTLYHLRLEHDLALRAAAHEVDIRATLLVQRLNAALIADPKGSEAEIFRSVLEAHPDERLAQSILIDHNGRLVEFDRTQAASNSPLSALFGDPQSCLIGRRLGRRDQIPDRARRRTICGGADAIADFDKSGLRVAG